MAALLDVWREVGRHLRIEEAVDLVAPIVSREVPLEGLRIRRLHLSGMRAETVAESWVEARRWRDRGARSQTLSTAVMEALASWVRGGRPVQRCDPGDPLIELAGAIGWGGDVLLGLLAAGGQPGGVIAVFGGLAAFHASDVARVEQLIEPLGVALANDGRLAEMERMRATLEADRRALLTRLARQDVSEAIVGATAGLRDVMLQVERVAGTEAPVLLLGETGSGKEVVAREIHKRSHRSGGPIERINCGAIPSGLIDSELFGHERGSFTGAVSSRKGWFERAAGGTLFLDEIGELPLEAQVRLLRVLQDGSFERVGGQATLHADVRIIAATHRDLGRMVAAGSFREDLWFRLNVFPIRIPPLRDRPEDIAPLAAHFGWSAGRRLGRGPLAPTPDDLDLLVSYPWPGNVRELAAVIERAAILGNGERLDVSAALGGVPAPLEARDRRDDGVVAAAAAQALTPLDEAMARHIRGALARCRGRIEGVNGAARLLDINPHTLRSRMRKLGIDWTVFRTS